MRISTLGEQAQPGSTIAGLGKLAQTGFGYRSPESKARAFGEAYKYGLTGVRAGEQAAMGELFGGVGRTPVGRFLERTVPEWLQRPIHGVAGGWASTMLWGHDEATRAVLMKQALKDYGGDAWLAADAVRHELVNYGAKVRYKTGGQLMEMMDMWGGGGGNEDVKEAANKARDDRKDLDKRYKEKLLALLTEDQKGRLPEEQKERGGMFGMDGGDFFAAPEDDAPPRG